MDGQQVTKQPSKGGLSRHAVPVLQRSIILNTPEKVDDRDWKALSSDFLKVMGDMAGVPGEMVGAAGSGKNFDLELTGDPKSGTDEAHLGITHTEIKLGAESDWQDIRSLSPVAFSNLHKNEAVRTRVRIVIRFDPASTKLRSKEWYVLFHEFAVHALEYWPLLKNIVNGKQVQGSITEQFGPGGSMHPDVHHQKLLHRSDPVYEELLKVSWMHMMDMEIKEMLAIEKDKKGDETGRKKNRVWNSDQFIATHQEDVVTQIFGDITAGLDHELEDHAKEHRRFANKKESALSKGVLKNDTIQLLKRVVIALEHIKKVHDKGWIQLGQALEMEKSTVGWSDVAEGHFELLEKFYGEIVVSLKENLLTYD